MKAFICKHWHCWKGNSNYLLSNEDTKQLRQFKTIDDCINYLFVNGNREAARALNKHIKAD